MTTSPAQQIAWQKQAHKVLGALIDRAYREGLPPLSWTIGDAGVTLVGRANYPSGDRRAAITAWSAALGIAMSERLRGDGTMLFGTAEHVDTPQGWASVTLTAEILEDDGDE